MLFFVYLISVFATVRGQKQQDIEVEEYIPGIDTYNFYDNRFTDTLQAEYFLAVVKGIRMEQKLDKGYECLDNFL